MKFGTTIRLSDGREATVVYHGLDGYGVVWGIHSFTKEQTESALCANTLFGSKPKDYPVPVIEAMLRAPYPSSDVECVGGGYEVVEEP